MKFPYLDVLIKAANEVDVRVQSQTYTVSSNRRLAMKTPQELNEQDAELGELEKRVHKMTENVHVLEKKLDDLQEFRSVLLQVSQILQNSVGPVQQQAQSLQSMRSIPTFDGKFENDEEAGAVAVAGEKEKNEIYLNSSNLRTGVSRDTFQENGVKFVVGVIQIKKYNAFERVMWRAMRGNVYISKSNIYTYTSTGNENPKEEKCVFIIFGHGAAALTKVQKICTALSCRTFPEIANEDASGRADRLVQVDAQINDLTSILFNTRQTCRSELSKIAESVDEQLAVVLQQKAIYAVMNLLHYDSGRKCLIGEAWCETGRVRQVDEALQKASDRAGLDVSSILTVLKRSDLIPPTHFPTNKFTQVFQDMNDAYGIARYREINPAIFMIVTFPFLFSLMFGDVGHAIIMLLVSGLLLVFETRIQRSKAADSELFGMIFSARYILLLMSLFSIYTGFIYNDIFSKSVGLFMSMFEYNSESGESKVFSSTYVYPFGIDPLWNHASNNLNFTNAVKMKLSIVIAILHMNLGICLCGVNFVLESDWTGFFCRFVPQFIFFNALFGYMCFLIIWKWISPTIIDRSILNTFINMIMKLGAVEGSEPTFFPGQVYVQQFLLFLAVISVPWMIFGRSVLFLLRKKRIEAQGYQETDRRGSGESLSSTSRKAAVHDGAEGEESFGSILTHDAIHAIEFVLGSVSNTASYLRLWALSLAHAQLSEVLWSLCLEVFLFNPIFLIFGYAIWFFGTLALMVAMEGLSAFLHALRLHWVEFNNKFYGGNGVKFEPYTLNQTTGQATIIPASQPLDF
jgi:V-type H+-transporting ATPase subunit a